VQSTADMPTMADDRPACTVHRLQSCEHEFFPLARDKKKNRIKMVCGHCGGANAKAMRICLNCEEVRCVSCKDLS
jgi:hypothetical protein